MDNVTEMAGVPKLRFTQAEAAWALGVSVSTLKRLIRSHEIAAHRSTGTDKGHVFITREALDEYVRHLDETNAA